MDRMPPSEGGDAGSIPAKRTRVIASASVAARHLRGRGVDIRLCVVCAWCNNVCMAISIRAHALAVFVLLAALFFITVPLTARAALTDGVVGYWSLDDNDVSGIYAYDLSGQCKTGTASGAPTSITGKSTQGRTFDGVDDYYSTPLTFTHSNFTVSAWVNKSGSGGVIASSRANGNQESTGFNLSLQGSSASFKVQTNMRYSGDTQEYPSADASATYSYPAGQWHLLTGVRTGNFVKLYIDGVEVSSKYIPSSYGVSGASGVRIGRFASSNTSIYQGGIDEVMVHNRALSAAEVAQLYAQTSAQMQALFPRTLPTVTIAATTPTAAYQDGVGQFTITRSINHCAPLTVPFSITGTAGGYYTLSASSPIVIPGSQTSTLIDVTPTSYLPGDRTVINTVSSNSAYTLGTPSSATVTLEAADVVVLATSGTGQWVVPDNWDPNNNSIEVIGGGGGGSKDQNSGGGGGGGAYAKVINVALTPGSTITYQVGAGADEQQSGGDTWFNRTSGSATTCNASTMLVCAKGGTGTNNQAGGAGGQASASVGQVKYSGGNGGTKNGCLFQECGSDGGSGGGGAAGPYGAGVGGVGATGGSGASGAAGGAGGAGFGGVGGASDTAGGNGTEWGTAGSGGGGGGGTSNDPGKQGGLYGGGGGGKGDDGDWGYGAAYTAGHGGVGYIRIVSAPAPTVTIVANPSTPITVGQSTTITATFTAGPGDTLLNTAINGPAPTPVPGGYAWTLAPGLSWTPPTNKTYVFTPTAPGTFTFIPDVESQLYSGWGHSQNKSVEIVVNCPANTHAEGSTCVANTRSCGPANSNNNGTQTWNTVSGTWGTCTGFTCVSGYEVSGSSCVQIVTEPVINGLQANPSRVRSGNNTTLTWGGTDLPATCTLSATPSVSGYPTSVPSTPTGNSTGVSAGPITQTTIFTLTCTTAGGDGSAQTTVGVVPVFQEI